MRGVRWTLLSLLVVVGCADGAPPLDELPLRDALRADPAVVAELGDSARQRLAARFDAAAAEQATADTVVEAKTPAAEIAALDDVRARRGADAVVIVAIGDGVARTVVATAGAADGDPLPALEGEVATTTAALEARAMSGAAAAPLRAILEASGARRLERVVGWPAGAVAIGQTIYVNAAWLVALAPGAEIGDSGAPDVQTGRAAGDVTSAAVPSPPAAVAPAATIESFDGGRAPDDLAYPAFDAGTIVPPLPPPPPSPPPPGPSFWDACAAGSDGCAASSDSCDTSDGEDDSCSSTDDGSDDSCSTPPDDGSCRMAPGRERPRAATIVWVLAPLGFLIGRRR
jgi:hypothetical protein